jgi:hypothetical protein
VRAAGGRTLAELEAALEGIRRSPREAGVLELIARRPALGEREVVEEALLDLDEGLVGDSWRARGSRRTADGSANPEAQVTLMNARAAAAIAGARERWALAGDQLYVDLDLAVEALPAGSLLAVGEEVVLVVSAEPHTGCAAFTARFGSAATRFVNSPAGRELRLRGVNARVLVPGRVRRGDPVRRLPPDGAPSGPAGGRTGGG